MARKPTGKYNADYITIKLPKDMVRAIDVEVDTRAFTSRTDYLKFLIRNDVEGDK